MLSLLWFNAFVVKKVGSSSLPWYGHVALHLCVQIGFFGQFSGFRFIVSSVAFRVVFHACIDEGTLDQPMLAAAIADVKEHGVEGPPVFRTGCVNEGQPRRRSALVPKRQREGMHSPSPKDRPSHGDVNGFTSIHGRCSL